MAKPRRRKDDKGEKGRERKRKKERGGEGERRDRENARGCAGRENACLGKARIHGARRIMR